MPTTSRILALAIPLPLVAAGALAQDLIFADGFESGDVSAWSLAVGLPEAPPCVAGLSLSGALDGDLGPMPGGAFAEITCLEMVNDRPFERRREAAFSGIPMPRDAALTTTDGLVVIGPGGRRVAAQFDVLSRWGGPLEDAALPIRWLEVTLQPAVAANTATVYALRRYDTPPAAADPFAATITPSGAQFIVDTGLATFTVDPANPALFAAIAIDPDDDGAGRETVYSHSAGAGPKLVFDPGGGDVVLDTTDPARVTVDADGFRIVESGPVKVVVSLRGHFSAPGGASLCDAIAPPYERFGYTAVATFSRASRDVELQFQVRNECSDAFTIDWMDDAVAVKRASWELPLDAGLSGTVTTYHAGGGAVGSSAAGFSGATVVEQRKGGGVPWQRRARVRRDGTTLESGVFFEQPLLALADGSVLAAVQMPWMRYREPQALAAAGKTLALATVSEELVVGEAKAIWGFGRLHLTSVDLASRGGSLESYLEEQRARGQARLERGLLVRAELAHVGAAGILASLGDATPSALKTYYRDTLGFIHQQTVKPGGQWEIAKTFGSQLWPDVQFDFFFGSDNPFENAVASNYWNASGAELTEFLRTGEPKWVWDFALPQSWQQTFTAHLNLGHRAHGNRNGYSVSGTGSGEGHWNRDGDNSSDDYNYNLGMQLAYALRPNAAVRDRFGQAGRTTVERYDVPWAQQAQRDPFVNGVDLSRQHIQHFEHLANCAEFSPGARGQSCHGHLAEILLELVHDNLGSGVMCGEDIPAPNPCSTPQQFMTNAHIHHFLHRLHANYGDVEGLLRRALVESPRAFYTWAIPKQPDGVSIAIGPPDWPGGMDCTLTAGGSDVISCAGWAGTDPTFWENRPHTVALLLMAHELDPSIGLCQIAKDALDALTDADALGGHVGEDVGWFKGSAQMFQGLAFAVGGYDSCVEE